MPSSPKRRPWIPFLIEIGKAIPHKVGFRLYQQAAFRKLWNQGASDPQAECRLAVMIFHQTDRIRHAEALIRCWWIKHGRMPEQKALQRRMKEKVLIPALEYGWNATKEARKAYRSAKKTDTRQDNTNRIVGFLRDMNRPLKPKQIADALGLKGESVRQCLSRLFGRGIVGREHGNYWVPE